MEKYALLAIVAIFALPVSVSEYQKYSCKKEYAHSTKTAEEIKKICSD